MGALCLHGYAMKRGKHKGDYISVVPTDYLKWMVRERVRGFSWAAAELERRSEKASRKEEVDADQA